MPRRTPILVAVVVLITITVGVAVRRFGGSAVESRGIEVTAQRSSSAVVILEGTGDLRIVERSRESPRDLGPLQGTPAAVTSTLDMLMQAFADSPSRSQAVEVRASEAAPWFRVAWVIGALTSTLGPELEFRLGRTESAEPAVERVYMSPRGFAVIRGGQETIPLLVAQFLDSDLPPGDKPSSPFRFRIAAISASTPWSRSSPATTPRSWRSTAVSDWPPSRCRRAGRSSMSSRRPRRARSTRSRCGRSSPPRRAEARGPRRGEVRGNSG